MYGAKTWTFMVQLVQKFKVTQRALKRIALFTHTLVSSLRDRISGSGVAIFAVKPITVGVNGFLIGDRI